MNGGFLETASHPSPWKNSNAFSATHSPPYPNDGTTKVPWFFPKMGFLSAFTLRFTLFLWIAVSFASTSPTHHSGSSTTIHRVVRAVTRELVVDEDAGTVVDTNTQRRIDQGSASDGAGSGFNIPAVLWLSFGLAVGLYLTLGGMRLWRMTTAIAIGLILTICGQSSLSGDPCFSNRHD